MTIQFIKEKFKEYKETRPEKENKEIQAIDYFIQWIATQDVITTEMPTTQTSSKRTTRRSGGTASSVGTKEG